MTIEQLRTAVNVDGVSDVILKGEGADFQVHIALRNGGTSVLSTARSSAPRTFSNPATAFNALLDAGITQCRIEASAWNPRAANNAR
ncbi:MAG: hypothetical protein LBE21_02525, partial [Pseudomonadales bacterium]|nr:hypothetical protein [Pseudomonadales bacterium]